MRLEGGPISVASTFSLPAQPATGQAVYVPLGGDGYVAPFAAWSVQGFGVTGDAGGGTASLVATLDDRFCSLVSWVHVGNAQASAADAAMRIALFTNSGVSPSQVESLVVVDTGAVSSSTIDHQWNPTPTILPGGQAVPQVSVNMVNVLADVLTMDFLVYLFNIRVRELTPMGPLLWARGAT